MVVVVVEELSYILLLHFFVNAIELFHDFHVVEGTVDLSCAGGVVMGHTLAAFGVSAKV